MANTVTQTFIPGPRLIDGSDLNRLVAQANAGFTTAGVQNFVSNTAVSTVGAATLTAAQLITGLITRSGSTAAFTDTTDTAVAIVAALPGYTVGQSFNLLINNTTAFPETIAGGTGVTVTGNIVIPANSTGEVVVKITSATAVSVYMTGASANTALPATKFTTAALTAGTIPAASITGAAMCYWTNTGATPGAQTFPTAATLFANIPNAYVGMSTAFRVINTGAGTLTLTADAGPTITITGTATVAQNVTRDYVLTFTSATAATVQSVGSGVSP